MSDQTPAKAPQASKPAYSKGEEIASASIHGAGILFGVVALAVLATLATKYGNVWTIVGVCVFGASVVLMYAASTLYHAIPSPRAKILLKKFDHISIFYLIAGTYTPFLLDPIRSTGAWVAFGIIWGLTLVGTILKLCAKPNGLKLWSIGLYLAMGWMAIFLLGKMVSVMPVSGIVFLAAGGLLYTLGVVFYVQKKRPYMHAVWHLFVLGGTIMHFFSVLYSCVLV